MNIKKIHILGILLIIFSLIKIDYRFEEIPYGLSVDDAELIAQEIVSNWDYSEIYNSIADDISHYADANDIDLEGKDGVESDEPDRLNRDAGSIARQRLVNNNIYVLNSPNSPFDDHYNS